VQLIDSAAETAHLVAGLLGDRNSLRSEEPLPPRYFVTDESTRFKRVGGSFVGAELHDVTQVDLEP
jgi:glutamate racemase